MSVAGLGPRTLFGMELRWVQRRLAEMDTIAQYLPPAGFREDVADYMRF